MTTQTMMGIAIALATMLASPAFAQSAIGQSGEPYFTDNAYTAYGQEAPILSPAATVRRLPQNASNPAWDVYDGNGRYLGSDPDPAVREMLARDPNEGR
jgi:hypothetical protein